MLVTLAVENYRSLRRLILPLRRLNVVTGANGSGKSSLYRSLRLLAAASRNGAVAALAREGGLPSTLWAGPETVGRQPVQGTVRTKRVALRLGFAGDEFGYAIDLGLPQVAGPTLFGLDPEIKSECTWAGPVLRPSTRLTERTNSAVGVRGPAGSWQATRLKLRPYDSMLAEFVDPELAPDLMLLRERIRSWRFYDQVRTDADAPMRAAQVGTRTPVLGHDGADLAPALETIREIGDGAALEAAVDLAFPGSQLGIDAHAGRFALTLTQPGMLRPLDAAELSDGTLRYLAWVAALLTPRPPELLVLNEPENSLHPDLIRPLAALIAGAAQRMQIVLVTHSRALASALDTHADDTDLQTVELTKEHGETQVVGQNRLDEPPWHWPKR
ncbi:AAA family ATPase [Asanoa sp. WMMD1127]|uniref:AAA family ATPase n=1 Tax=Asanoa sp. WMMD1127 TaxID=3016107 RepID=UPI002416739D|nr:AAA family ATPase [Asanoa sp. WMMD1127]MDG4821479.1 AAA family ATPase [Asanoa sp. WMMD1127]